MEDYSIILVSLMRNLNIGSYGWFSNFDLPDCVASVPMFFINANWLIATSTMYWCFGQLFFFSFC
jgi:hypothetical protein